MLPMRRIVQARLKGGCQATCLSGMKRKTYPHTFAFSPRNKSGRGLLQGGLMWSEDFGLGIARLLHDGALSEHEVCGVGVWGLCTRSPLSSA
jgi:hypothetical protein